MTDIMSDSSEEKRQDVHRAQNIAQSTFFGERRIALP
jgi:hypothetical protein